MSSQSGGKREFEILTKTGRLSKRGKKIYRVASRLTDAYILELEKKNLEEQLIPPSKLSPNAVRYTDWQLKYLKKLHGADLTGWDYGYRSYLNLKDAQQACDRFNSDHINIYEAGKYHYKVAIKQPDGSYKDA